MITLGHTLQGRATSVPSSPSATTALVVTGQIVSDKSLGDSRTLHFWAAFTQRSPFSTLHLKMLDCAPPWPQSLSDHSGTSLQTQTASSITIFFPLMSTFEITRPPGCWLTCVHHIRLNALARHKRSQFTQERTSTAWDLPNAPHDARRAAHIDVRLPSPPPLHHNFTAN